MWRVVAVFGLAANDAAKAADVNLVNLRPFGACGRLWMACGESEIVSAAQAAIAAVESLDGKTLYENPEL